MVGVFAQFRGQFGPKRTSGARALREDAQGGLFCARKLWVRTVECGQVARGRLSVAGCPWSVSWRNFKELDLLTSPVKNESV